MFSLAVLVFGSLVMRAAQWGEFAGAHLAWFAGAARNAGLLFPLAAGAIRVSIESSDIHP
ncbi:MAG: hypothetical protein LBV61_05120 [Burkholderiaceae bacterium]|nr:hypothetical protein [Burkholderiaceae bacterium]